MAKEKKQKEKKYFLVVVPDTRKRSSIISSLNKMGYENVKFASDGAAAYNILKRRKVDCIISAWEMPQMDGISLLKVVRSDDKLYQIPFCIITRHINREKVMEAGRHGVSTILVEPVTSAQIREKIMDVINAKPDVDMERIEALFLKATHLTEEKLYNKALRIYGEILEVHEDAEVYYNVGYIKTVQGKYDEAMKAFGKAVAINKLHARAYKMMGKVHLKTDEPKKAEKCFEKAGEIFLEREMDKEAEEAFQEVLRINPDTLNIYNSLGIIYRRQHNARKAVDLYRIALKVNPDDEGIYYNLGRAFMENREIQEAKRALEKALKLNPRFIQAKRMLDAIKVAFDG